MVLSQFARYLSSVFDFIVDTTDDHWNLVLTTRLGTDWSYWKWFRRACLLQGWKRWGANGLTLLALTSDLGKLVLLVNRCHGGLK